VSLIGGHFFFAYPAVPNHIKNADAFCGGPNTLRPAGRIRSVRVPGYRAPKECPRGATICLHEIAPQYFSAPRKHPRGCAATCPEVAICQRHPKRAPQAGPQPFRVSEVHARGYAATICIYVCIHTKLGCPKRARGAAPQP